MIYASYFDSPIGKIHIFERDGALIELRFKGQKDFPADFGTEGRNSPTLSQAKYWLERYFAGQKPSISELRLEPAGSEFRRAVWEMICRIPYGEVTTYGEIARTIAAKRGLVQMSAQAVGGAVGHNPIPLIIPCHRVVGTNGGLVGYSGGISKKIALLKLEGHLIDESQMKLIP